MSASVLLAVLAVLLGAAFCFVGYRVFLVMLPTGIFFFGPMVLFSSLTLPLGIDASRRATRLLHEARLVQNEADARGARAVA